MDFGLNGKTALVTGGSAGLGFAIASELQKAGASLVLASRSAENLEKARLALGGTPQVRTVDMGDEKKLRASLTGLPNIDIVIVNTGGPAAGEPSDITLEQWDKGYQALLRSTFILAELFLPAMRSRKWGRFLTITSTAAKEMIPKLPVSATFRAGLSAWTHMMAKQVGRDGVLVNNLLPGPTQTGRLQELEKKSPEFYRSMESELALGRIPQPEELGRVAAFLCSGLNTMITGQDIVADGGYMRSY